MVIFPVQGRRHPGESRHPALLRCWTLAFVGVTASFLSSPAIAFPHRIVSLNPCTDAILVEIARPDQIAALSFYSFDPASSSIPLATARKYKSGRGTAEDILRLKPDLVIGSNYTPIQTRMAVRKFGIAYAGFQAPATIAASKAQITEIAALIGATAKASALNRAIDAAVATPPPPAVDALVYRDAGLVLGTGSLTADIMAHTGFRNISSHYGIADWGVLPLEKLVRRPPPVLLHAAFSGADRARGERMLTHPVLRHMAAATQFRTLPSGLLNCGGPLIIPAASKLRQIRASVMM
jgi:iron complex transport system substrate-binding protein